MDFWRDRATRLRTLGGLALAVYLLLLVKLIVFKYSVDMTQAILSGWSMEGLLRHVQTANLIPLRTIGPSLFDPQLRVEVMALIYNVVAFVPLGVLLPGVWRRARSWRGVLLAGVLVSGALEIIQLITILGSPDIDDVILNIGGTALGYAAFLLGRAVYRRAARSSPA